MIFFHQILVDDVAGVLQVNGEGDDFHGTLTVPLVQTQTHERYLLIRGMPYKTVVAPILAADAVMDIE